MFTLALTLPPNYQVLEDSTPPMIRRKWFHGGFIFYAVFSLFMLGFLYLLLTEALPGTSIPWWKWGILLLFIASTVGFTYYAIAGFFNVTDIWVADDYLHIQSHPFPWVTDQHLPVKDLQQMFVKREVDIGYYGEKMAKYPLYMIFSQPLKNRKILREIDNPEVAVFLEKTLEKWLGIPDRPMAGEVGNAAFS